MILLAVVRCAPPSTESGNSINAFTRHLDKHIPRLLDKYEVPGTCIAIIREGKPVWSAAWGYADSEQKRKMTPGAVFRVESISKPVTAWGVMKLVEQGLIDPDAPVQQYLGDWKLPASPYPEERITVRKLLSHTAGMPLGTIGVEYSHQSDMPTLREYLTAEAILAGEPGSGFCYSNTGYNLLELIIEEVTGREFAEYMENEVLIPLGMSHSTFDWKDTLRPVIPTGYDLQGTPVPPYLYPARASGGLFSTVDDVARFVGAGMTGQWYSDQTVLSREGIRMLYKPEAVIPGLFGLVSDSYGLGHFIETLPDGRQAVWHGGQGHGWMTHFHSIPESGCGIVMLTNSQCSWPLIAAVLGDWARWSNAGPVKMSRITYGITALRAFTVIIVLGSLWQTLLLIRGWRRGTRRLEPLSGSSRPGRFLGAAIGMGIITGLMWGIAQPYLFVSSIFPSTSGWTGSSLLFLAIVLILSAMFPQIQENLDKR